MSSLIQRIKAGVPKERLERRPSLVAAHAFFTVVRSFRVGMSGTMTGSPDFPGIVSKPVRELGRIEQLPLGELMTWTDSEHPIERSIGMAALNSCLPLDFQKFFTGNGLELAARHGKGKNVVMVGHFPHLDEVRRVAGRFTILEKRPQPGDLPAEEAPRVIPEADLVAMTGITCLNDTIEGLLALKKPGALFIVLGPTVPLSPVLFEAGVDIIGGSWIDDAGPALSMLAQGGTARVLRGIRYVLAPRDPALVAGFSQIEPPPEETA